MFTRRQTILLIGSAALSSGVSRAAANTLAAPAGKPILRVTGNISVRNDRDAALFDAPMLEGFGMTSIETMTPWYTEKVRFEGVPMAKFLSGIGAKGDKLKVFALNDYASEIPISDFSDYGVILALKRNGQYMPVSDKGPLFIVYPFDAKPELKSQKYYSRCAWQIARMEVI